MEFHYQHVIRQPGLCHNVILMVVFLNFLVFDSLARLIFIENV